MINHVLTKKKEEFLSEAVNKGNIGRGNPIISRSLRLG